MKILILQDKKLSNGKRRKIKNAFEEIKGRWNNFTKVSWEFRSVDFSNISFEEYNSGQFGIKKTDLSKFTKEVWTTDLYQWDIVMFWVDENNWKAKNMLGWGMGRLYNHYGVIQIRDASGVRNTLEHELLHLIDDFWRINIGKNLDAEITKEIKRGFYFDWDNHGVHGGMPPWGKWYTNKKRYYYKPDYLHTFDALLKDFGLRIRTVYEMRKRLAIDYEKINLLKRIKALYVQILEIMRAREDRAYTKKEEAHGPKPNLLDAWADAIKNFEGWFEPGQAGYTRGSVSYRNNNPGNLRYAGQRGATGKDHRNFAIFPNYEAGWDALIFQLRIAATGKSRVYKPSMTLLEFFKVYAPASDNNYPENYAKAVAKNMGVKITTQIKEFA